MLPSADSSAENEMATNCLLGRQEPGLGGDRQHTFTQEEIRFAASRTAALHVDPEAAKKIVLQGPGASGWTPAPSQALWGQIRTDASWLAGLDKSDGSRGARGRHISYRAHHRGARSESKTQAVKSRGGDQPARRDVMTEAGACSQAKNRGIPLQLVSRLVA